MHIQQTLLSGDQNIFWDAPLKLKVAEARGIKVHHMVHSIDYFSRKPVRFTKSPILVCKETTLPDGNINCWTASMECAEFLGKCALPLKTLQEYGVDYRRIARWENIDPRRAVERLTESDWWGVFLEDDGRIAHDVMLGEIKEGYKSLKTYMKKSLRKVFRDKKEYLDRFEEVWRLFAGAYNNNSSLGRVYREILASMINLQIITIIDSVAYFRDQACELLRLWINHYPEVVKMYNEAVAEGGMFTAQVDPAEGELPFSLISEGEKHKGRRDITRQDVVRGLPENSLVIPKAVPLLLEFLLKAPLLQPEKGSAYSGISLAFGAKLQKLFPALSFHPIYRVQFNALDNLAGVNDAITLPNYLASFFGETVSANDFALSWREVVERAESKAKTMKEQKPLDWVVEEKVISRETRQRHADLRELLRDRKFVSDEEKRFWNAEITAIEEEAHRAWAHKLCDILHVKNALLYWNARPMYWWVHVLPKWEANIIQNATISVESAR